MRCGISTFSTPSLPATTATRILDVSWITTPTSELAAQPTNRISLMRTTRRLSVTRKHSVILRQILELPRRQQQMSDRLQAREMPVTDL